MQTLPQLRAHVGAALNIGASPLQLREAIYQCAPYIGFPKTLNAIDIANGVLEANGISLPLENAGTVDATDPSAREQAGAAIQAPLYGNEVKEVFSALPEPFDQFVPHLLTSSAFGDFATRGGLDVAQRELISLVAIAAIGATTQLRPHVAGAIRAGSSRQKVAAAWCRSCPTSVAPTPCPAWSSWPATTRTPPQRPTAEKRVPAGRHPLRLWGEC